jgi:hypothetical protein
VRRVVVGFFSYYVLRLAEISVIDCKRLCVDRLCKALCYQGVGSMP